MKPIEAIEEIKNGGSFEDLEEPIETLEKLITDYNTLKNEFCYQCGKYKNEHLGACDGCRYHEV